MHLSLLSDSYLSDRLSDAGLYAEDEIPTLGRAHRDGIIRGLVMLGVFAILICVGFVTNAMPCAEADAASHRVVSQDHVATRAGRSADWAH